MKLEDEIQQKKFKNELVKLAVNLMYSASWIRAMNLKVLKKYNLSIQQFNILRILKGQHPKPVTVKLLTERMLDKMSNASRLVEKLNQKKLVERKSCPEDRRQLDIVITAKGLKAVEKISIILEKETIDSLSNLTKKEAKSMNELLDKMRNS